MRLLFASGFMAALVSCVDASAMPKCMKVLSKRYSGMRGMLRTISKKCFQQESQKEFLACMMEKGIVIGDFDIMDGIRICFFRNLPNYACDGPQLMGGYGPTEQKPLEELTEALVGLEGDLAQAVGMPLRAPLRIISYKSQVVAGTNYLVKIKDSNYLTNYIHAVIYRNLDGTYEVTNAKSGFDVPDCLDPEDFTEKPVDSCDGPQLMGGYGSTIQDSNPELDTALGGLKTKLELVSGLSLQSPLEMLSYKTQVVNGFNYMVKIRDVNEQILHAVLYQHWSSDSFEVTDAKGGFLTEDCLDPYDF